MAVKPWSLTYGEKSGFSQYFVFLLVLAGLPCVGVVVLWSSIGYGEDAFNVLDTGKGLSRPFFAISALVFLFLYFADFFWPPHLPGRYCILAVNDRQAGRCILAFALGLLVFSALFLAKTYPRVPIVVTVLCGPLLMMCLRGLTCPQDPYQKVGHDAIQSKTVDKHLTRLWTFVYAEKDANLFYSAAAAAFAISGVVTLVIWTVCFASSNRNGSKVTKGEMGLNLLAAPVFAGMANLAFSFFILIRVRMARAADNYDTSLFEIIHEGGSDLHREICQDAILVQYLQEHHILDDFRKPPVDAPLELGKQHACRMKILSKMLKVVGCSLLLLIGATYVVAELVVAASHIARLALDLFAILFVTFVVLAAIWFRRPFAHMWMRMQHLLLWRMTLGLASNNWVRAGVVTAVLPYAPVWLLFNSMKQDIRRCRGLDSMTASGSSEEKNERYITDRMAMVLESMQSWDWVSMTAKIYVWGFAMIGYVLFPKLLNVFLAWFISLVQGLNFYIIAVSALTLGLGLFLLPPVPGIPVYLFGGFLIAAACHPSDHGTGQPSPGAPNGFAFGVIIAICIGFLLKLLACVIQHKLIGEQLGSSCWVKQQVGVHKPFIRAVELVLSDRGYSMGKVGVLCGGADWPTSVLMGILRLPIVLHGWRLPIVVPCIMTGAFYVRRPESDFFKSAANLMLSATIFVHLALLVGAAWAIKEKLEQKHWEVSKPLLENVDLDWLDYRSHRLDQASALSIDAIPSGLLVLFKLGCLVVVLVGHAFCWVPTYFFTSFEVNSDIKTLIWLGSDGLFLDPGLGGICLAFLGFCCWAIYACWRRVQQRASRMFEAKELVQEEDAWKAQRRKQALEASTLCHEMSANLDIEAWKEPVACAEFDDAILAYDVENRLGDPHPLGQDRLRDACRSNRRVRVSPVTCHLESSRQGSNQLASVCENADAEAPTDYNASVAKPGPAPMGSILELHANEERKRKKQRLWIWVCTISLSLALQLFNIVFSDEQCFVKRVPFKEPDGPVDRFGYMLWRSPTLIASLVAASLVARFVDSRGRYQPSSKCHMSCWWYALSTLAQIHLWNQANWLKECKSEWSGDDDDVNAANLALAGSYLLLVITVGLFGVCGAMKVNQFKHVTPWHVKWCNRSVVYAVTCGVLSLVFYALWSVTGQPAFLLILFFLAFCSCYVFGCFCLWLGVRALLLSANAGLYAANDPYTSKCERLDIYEAARFLRFTAYATTGAFVGTFLAIPFIKSSMFLDWTSMGPIEHDFLYSCVRLLDVTLNVIAAAAMCRLVGKRTFVSLEDILGTVADAAAKVSEVNVHMVLHRSNICQEDLASWKQQFAGHIGTLDLNELYEVKSDFRHYRLGVTFEGLVRILQRIGFITKKRGAEGCCAPDKWDDSDWEYSKEYARDPKTDDWLDKIHGPIKPGGDHAMMNVLGYDACIYVKRWLKENECMDRSVLEAVLTKPEWADLRKYVGVATLFWSHLQSEPLLGLQSTLSTMSLYFKDCPNAAEAFIWCDIVNLRQCQSDFKVKCVIESVHCAGTLVASIDQALAYPKRSFCLVESFAAIVGGCTYKCVAYTSKNMLARDPVASQKAETRSKEAKEKIDQLIEETISFSALDAVMMDCIECGLASEMVTRSSHSSFKAIK